MTTTKHTPGPWFSTEDNLVLTADHTEIAEVFNGEGNVLLIAAAPELLAALEALVERGTDSPVHMAAEAAIVKALGATP